jgi:hypothetical protein
MNLRATDKGLEPRSRSRSKGQGREGRVPGGWLAALVVYAGVGKAAEGCTQSKTWRRFEWASWDRTPRGRSGPTAKVDDPLLLPLQKLICITCRAGAVGSIHREWLVRVRLVSSQFLQLRFNSRAFDLRTPEASAQGTRLPASG